ncbi:beta-ketoacyl-[acyl-carrier-protein] synthase family protein [Polyangium jinanense]|uniref:Beta-ketoacyl-[acyl-carrier-protein] synthase family protein n=1 Tax=Polyangium jinanense TaxID=2829994 RepID=A0A9X3XHQ0_9BACT|nr:beta-ketoacyl-[acyl-carrier-protein] synthase family protein [Polyangium jinanense]MDC3962401.1 beta-ketoacyl-[acyl-carrier-protein] synthase family protein [Polyangium jinanense]MDC3989293.1 beta-ketoacyl-[acyl-carrier-protein] synthase family protein [Polyangium jinanense]
MSRRVVITGIGIIAPNGIGKDAVWTSVNESRVALSGITRFDTEGFSSDVAGELRGFDPLDFMNVRLSRKLDPFTQYAIAASQLALKDAELDLARVDKLAFGVYVGNCFGGWAFTDRELRKLHNQGPRELSAFQATAWFPAAPQGQISILLELRGHSKTIVCDRASGLASIGYAARNIAQGKSDLILAGGTEAPITPLIFSACSTDGVLAKRRRGAGESYLPFDEKHEGLVLGEGSAFLLLEEREHALRRNAKIYAELHGFAMTSDACHPAPLPAEERGLSVAMREALRDAAVAPEAVSFVMADGMATKEGDYQEAQAIHKVFGERAASVPVTAPKSMFGHLYGAAGAVDVALSALSLQHRVIPPTASLTTLASDCRLDVVTTPRKAEAMDYVLIAGRGSGGTNAAVVIAAPEQAC